MTDLALISKIPKAAFQYALKTKKRFPAGEAATAGVQLPANTTLLTYQQAWRCNNTTALAVGLDIMSDYIETDY